MANKVQFGLCDVHFAKITVQNDGTFSYGTVKAIPGAVSLSMDASGDQADFAADNNARYFSDYANEKANRDIADLENQVNDGSGKESGGKALAKAGAFRAGNVIIL